MAAISILGPGGYSKEPYGSFAGKVASVRIVSVLGPQGVPRPPYGSFGGKSLISTPVHFQPFINGYMGRMMTR